MVLFMVPDDDSLENEEKEKALLDTEELSEDEPISGSSSTDKVELDLEDAPFLEEEEEEPPPQAEDTSAPSLVPEHKPAAKKKSFKDLLKKKPVLISLIIGALLLIGGVVFLVSSGEGPGPEPTPTPEGTPTPTPTPEIIEILYSWEPFVVEVKDDDGVVHFLFCRFGTSTTLPRVEWELKQKNLKIRDGIYYYLRNKDYSFYADKEHIEILKKDLLSVINQYLAHGQLGDLLIEEYLVK